MCGLCIQNSAFWTSILVSMSTRPYMSFCAYKTAWLAQGILVSMCSSPHQWFCAFKTAPLGPKLHVSMGPSPNVWFLEAKQRLLDGNYKALWVKNHTGCFCKQNFGFWTRLTSLYRSQTWPVILCMYNSVLNIRITSLYGFQPWSVVLCFQNSDLMTTIWHDFESLSSPVPFCIQNSVPSIRITSLYVSQPSPVVFVFKTAWLASELLVSRGYPPHDWPLDAKQRLLDQNNECPWVPALTCRFVNANQRD